jgi:L-fuconolactonase
MRIVDSHCHVAAIWYEPVETLLFQMDRTGVGLGVLIQILGQYDNSYQQDCCSRFSNRFTSVVGLDTQSADAPQQLVRLSDQGATGVRLRPTSHRTQPDPLAIRRLAEATNMAVSCVGSSAAFAAPEFADIVTAVPTLVIVLEHLGGNSRPDADADDRADRRKVFALARYANVYLKVPGLGELAPRAATFSSDARPIGGKARDILREALDHFGPARLMWASDFPPVAAREGYANSLNWCRDVFADLREADQELIFGGVAHRVFRFSQQ